MKPNTRWAFFKYSRSDCTATLWTQYGGSSRAIWQTNFENGFSNPSLRGGYRFPGLMRCLPRSCANTRSAISIFSC